MAFLIFVSTALNAQTYTVLHQFSAETGAPEAPLIQALDGNLYGTTSAGGDHGLGSVFRIDGPGNVTRLHSFSGSDGSDPYGGLVQATDGNFYGTTTDQSSGGFGTIFRIDSIGDFTTVYRFTGAGDGGNPFGSLIQASDGFIYGTTELFGSGGGGTIFKIDLQGNLSTVHAFSGGSDGANPYTGLIQGSDGNLYGTTSQGGSSQLGTVFRMDSTGNVTILHNFLGTPSEGSMPEAALVQGNDGNYYGATLSGGASSSGTIFRIDSSGNLATLYSFANDNIGYGPHAPLIQGSDGYFYGTASQGGSGFGTVFRMDLAGHMAVLYDFVGTGTGDGAYPNSALIERSDGYLYGTTEQGGYANVGTVFKSTTLGSLSVVHAFGWDDGQTPWGGLIQTQDGSFYGTTAGDLGYTNWGNIFRIDSAGRFTSLHDFGGGDDGGAPYQGLVQAQDGAFYGTTQFGGTLTGMCAPRGCGVAFRIDSLGNFTTLHTFAGGAADGAWPFGPLLQGSDGNLYGTTSGGGAGSCLYTGLSYGCGTIFRISSTGNLTVLHNFGGPPNAGFYPSWGLMVAADGYMYGMTTYGGPGACSDGFSTVGCGTVYKIDYAGNLTYLHMFGGPPNDGALPQGGLTQTANGMLYGTTGTGGGGGDGTIFSMDSQGNETIIYSSAGGTAGITPYGVLCQASDGYLYGTMWYGGTNNAGTIYKIDSSGALTTVYNFDYATGGNSYPGVIQGSDGNFYSTATQTSTAGTAGVVYQLGLCLPPVASSNSPICSGQTLQLRAFPSSAASYSWAGPNGFTSTQLAPTIPNATGASAGAYTVTVTAGSCSVAQATVNVVVNPGPAPAPAITCPLTAPPNTSGLTASVAANAGDTYNWSIFGGTIDSGQGTNSISFTSGSAGTLMTLSVVESNGNCSGTDSIAIQVDFLDVPPANPFHPFVVAIGRNRVTAGCGRGDFCPAASVLRSSMAVFLLKSEHGSAYAPPPFTGIFADLSPSNPFAAWIEQLYTEGITAGCNAVPLLYCPSISLSRAGMAVFMLVAQHGTGYTPPACTGIFADVACPGAFTNWIEQLYAEGITGGCDTNPLRYCPTSPVTRAQMAVFLTTTFSLP